MNYYELVDRNFKSFAKAGVSASMLTDLERLYDIEMTITQYVNGKKVDSQTEMITTEEYAYCLSGIAFFKDRLTKTYLKAGIFPDRMTCWNPSRTEKWVRTLKFTEKTH